METVNFFEKNRYLILTDFLDKENCNELTKVLQEITETSGKFDSQCPTSKSVRDIPVLDKLLIDLLPHFEIASGKKLLPTYAYARLYKPGETLKIHKDRPACEISATLTLGFEGNPWPIYFGKPSTEKTENHKTDHDGNIVYIENPTKVEMNIGDVVLYRGCEMYHWREEYSEGNWQAQVFLHYVDANGPNTEWIYDKRGGLNLIRDTDLTVRVYDDVLTEKDCDMLISLYNKVEDEEAGIGVADGISGKIDKKIRNVNRVVLPVHKGIGARLAAVGLDANSRFWNFDIKRANQSEFLKYPAGGGRYKGHVDTFLSKDAANLAECRKLTVLAFLNDDFKGGKFFLQTGHKKTYPPQKKGTVLVFPSFLLHGVEDVEEGERFSVVTWMVGPWFK